MGIRQSNVEHATHEYRVQYRLPGWDEWRTVITNRGGGRPFFSLGAAKGVLTRERKAADRARLQHNTRLANEGKPLQQPREWRIQSRPTQNNWTDVEL